MELEGSQYGHMLLGIRWLFAGFGQGVSGAAVEQMQVRIKRFDCKCYCELAGIILSFTINAGSQERSQ